ncbi:MAG: DUF3180 domain-containing protein [Actinobacteria bacterium]|nr:DUF3180 domain-containing protein [Actinomycetota bacterium]
MTPTRLRTLLLITVAVAAVSWLLLRTVYSSLPSFPWTMLPALVIAGGGEAITARGLRARILGQPGTKPVPPLQVARMVALAKASSLAAALIGGVAAGFAAAAAGSLPAHAAGHDVFVATCTFGGAVLLAAAALYLEYCCRVPDDPDAARYVPPPPPPADPFH